MLPDDVCAEYAERQDKNRLTIQTYTDGETGADMVLIEGEAGALEFLGNVLIAQAQFERDCTFFFGPKTSGFGFFTEDSTHGIYVHRLPCVDEAGFKMAKSKKDT
jgi:hypothetical protein